MESMSGEAARVLRGVIARYMAFNCADLVRIADSKSAGESTLVVGHAGEQYIAEVLVLKELDGHIRVMAHLDGGPDGTSFLGDDYFLRFPDGRTAKST